MSICEQRHFYFFLPKTVHLLFPFPCCISYNFQYYVEKQWWERTSLHCSWSQQESFEFLIIMQAVSCRFSCRCTSSGWINIRLMKYPHIPSFLQVFIINGFWVLSDAFFASFDMIMWFFFFSQLMRWIILIF